ncbi:hypothetical protein [Synechococcus sp. M16CYN]|uniref:hypothetical protein n=1 Tax=Synechococcus sp. M16CYN TaxID=3103139 RepID=UPI00333E3FC7
MFVINNHYTGAVANRYKSVCNAVKPDRFVRLNGRTKIQEPETVESILIIDLYTIDWSVSAPWQVINRQPWLKW